MGKLCVFGWLRVKGYTFLNSVTAIICAYFSAVLEVVLLHNLNYFALQGTWECDATSSVLSCDATSSVLSCDANSSVLSSLLFATTRFVLGPQRTIPYNNPNFGSIATTLRSSLILAVTAAHSAYVSIASCVSQEENCRRCQRIVQLFPRSMRKFIGHQK